MEANMKSDYAIKTEVALQLTYILKHVFIYFDLKKEKNTWRKGMVTHSSILAWRTPWSEKPGRLQSRGLKESDMT